MQKIITPIEIADKQPDGGTITINTAALDRDKDHVFPAGAQVDNYLKNPVVQWGHNYYDPWAIIGKTTSLAIGADSITASFELRESANETDPQNIIRSLWDNNLIRAASIGFRPITQEQNEAGGFDVTEWELIEWSLVPIPANQEALRNTVKALAAPPPDAAVPPPTPTIDSATGNGNEAEAPEPEMVVEVEAEPEAESEVPDFDGLTPELITAIAQLIERVRTQIGD